MATSNPVSDPDSLMVLADALLRDAREGTCNFKEPLPAWVAAVSLVGDALKSYPAGSERDDMERWLVVQWRQPEWPDTTL